MIDTNQQDEVTVDLDSSQNKLMNRVTVRILSNNNASPHEQEHDLCGSALMNMRM